MNSDVFYTFWFHDRILCIGDKTGMVINIFVSSFYAFILATCLFICLSQNIHLIVELMRLEALGLLQYSTHFDLASIIMMLASV